MSREASHKKRPVPPALRPYIDMANILPAPEKLPGAEIAKALPEVEGLFIVEGWGFWGFHPHDYDTIQRLVDEHPRFREFLAGADLRDKAVFSEAHLRCNRLMGVRNLLYTIARRNATKGTSVVRINPAGGIGEPVSLYLDESGNFHFEIHPLVRALDGVEAARIRECPICGKIFWAGRIDKPACRPRCSALLRTRRWRDAHPDYKYQRYLKAEAKAGDRSDRGPKSSRQASQ